MIRWLALFQILAIVACGKPNHAKQDSAPAAEEANKKDTAARKKPGIDEATQIAALIDPEKLGTLKERGANPRIQKITAILATAKATGKNPQNRPGSRGKNRLGQHGKRRPHLQGHPSKPRHRGKTRRHNARGHRRNGDILSIDHVIPRPAPPSPNSPTPSPTSNCCHFGSTKPNSNSRWTGFPILRSTATTLRRFSLVSFRARRRAGQGTRNCGEPSGCQSEVLRGLVF